MIRGKYLTSRDDLDAVMEIRRRVFGDDPGLAPLAGPDDGDRMAVYALVYDADGAPSGAGRLYIDDRDRFMLDAVGVVQEARGAYLGDLILRMLLFRAQELNASAVYARATAETAPFFVRYGLKPLDETESERGVPLQLLRATAEEIDIEGECARKPR